jgi:hypothetical protein
VDRKREKGGQAMGLKRGQLTLSMGPARVEVASLYKEPLFQVRDYFFIFAFISATHAIICLLGCMIKTTAYSLLYRLKINHVTENRNMHLFLAQWVYCCDNNDEIIAIK